MGCRWKRWHNPLIGGRWCAVGSKGTILASTNGSDWINASSFSANGLFSVGFGNGLWLAGGSGILLRSSDGINWTNTSPGAIGVIVAVEYADGRWIALEGTEGIWTSSDAVSWQWHFLGTDSELFGIGYGDGRWIAVGENGTILQSGEPDLKLGDLQRLTNGEVRFTLTGQPGRSCLVETSRDLIDWMSLTNLPNAGFTNQIVDSQATNFIRRFYRAHAP